MYANSVKIVPSYFYIYARYTPSNKHSLVRKDPMTEVVNDVRINNDGNEQNGLLILYAYPNKEKGSLEGTVRIIEIKICYVTQHASTFKTSVFTFLRIFLLLPRENKQVGKHIIFIAKRHTLLI